MLNAILYIFPCHNKPMKPLKVDMHVHTRHSQDSDTDPAELVRKAAELGFDAIAVTDHLTTRGAIEAEETARRIGSDLIVFIGQEAMTRQGEILVYGMREDIAPEQDIVKVCREAKGKGGFLIVPHPFDAMRKGVGSRIYSILDYVDAVEGFNARTVMGRFNRKAREFVSEEGIPSVAGSDAHFLEEFGMTYNLVRSGKSREGILEAIRSGSTEPVIQRQGLRSGFKRGMRKIRSYF